MSKFVIFRVADVRKYLNDEQKQALMAAFRAIETKRREEAKPTDEPLFVLNMMDQFAQPAIEAYIRAAQQGGVGDSVGAEAALKAAQDIRQKGLMAGEPRLPTVG